MSEQSEDDHRTSDRFQSRLSRANMNRKRLVGSCLIMTLAAGGLFGACRASDITGPGRVSEHKQFSAGTPTTSMLVNERESTPATFHENPCDALGPALKIEGTTTTATHVSVSASGNMHIYGEVRTRGQATRMVEVPGDDDMWKADSRDFFELEAPPVPLGSAFETTKVAKDVFIGKGKNPNFYRHWTVHVTNSASGQTNATVKDPRLKCDG